MEVPMLAIACLLGLLTALCHASQFPQLEEKPTLLHGVSTVSALAFHDLEEGENGVYDCSAKDGIKLSLKEEEEEEEEGGENEKDIALVCRYGISRRRLENTNNGTKEEMKHKKKMKRKKKKKKKKKVEEENKKVLDNVDLLLKNKDMDQLSIKINKTQAPSSNDENLMNQIDACWRNDPNWANNRQHLVDCVVGFGYNTLGGKGGSIYVVNDTDDDPIFPKLGTLRYGVTRTKPLWIVFARDMVITLKNELMINSFKTIDGRGAKVEIAYGQCLALRHVSHIIIHGLHIHHCKKGNKGAIISSETHIGQSINGPDGDGIVVYDSKNVWIDHNSLYHCNDGLIDVVHASSDVTISNNYFTQHNKVMMLGHDDAFIKDKTMKVTVIYNHFGPGLVQRMPRCRWGYFHVANNRYTEWKMYAIGGSAKSTIRSEANYFYASKNPRTKKVTKRESLLLSPNSWNWRSINDLFLNGAYFEQSGFGTSPPYYTSRANFKIQSAELVPKITSNAGAIKCKIGSKC